MPGFAAFHIGIQTDETPDGDIDSVVLGMQSDDSQAYVDGMSE